MTLMDARDVAVRCGGCRQRDVADFQLSEGYRLKGVSVRLWCGKCRQYRLYDLEKAVVQ